MGESEKQSFTDTFECFMWRCLGNTVDILTCFTFFSFVCQWRKVKNNHSQTHFMCVYSGHYLVDLFDLSCLDKKEIEKKVNVQTECE